jgi:hypothetical protein
VSDCQLLPQPAYRGNHESLLADEDFANDLQLYLLEKSKTSYLSACTIVKYVASEAVQQKHGSVSIVEQTTCRWLNRMEWRYGKVRRGMYIDSHKRDDMVAYRTGFVERWRTLYAPQMITYNNGGSTAFTPITIPGQDPCFQLILVTHNESTSYAYNRRKSKWNAPSRLSGPDTEHKGDGASIMVSDFLTADWGRLVDNKGK